MQIVWFHFFLSKSLRQIKNYFTSNCVFQSKCDVFRQLGIYEFADHLPTSSFPSSYWMNHKVQFLKVCSAIVLTKWLHGSDKVPKPAHVMYEWSPAQTVFFSQVLMIWAKIYFLIIWNDCKKIHKNHNEIFVICFALSICPILSKIVHQIVTKIT